jgi:hypothetical protein
VRSLSDCIHDMLRTRTENIEIENLLSGQARDDSDDLASLLATLNLERLKIDADDRADQFAAEAAQLVRQAVPVAPIRPARSRVVPRLATAALAGVLVVGMAGVAQAADAAAPGDTLYGLDRALERVGINNGGLDERLDEAQALADDGRSAEALDHLADALDTSSPNAADALERAAERFGLHDNPSQGVHEQVAEMLDWIAERQASGREFGQGVAERAREIGAGQGGGPPATLPDSATENRGNTGNQDNSDSNDDLTSDEPPATSGSGSSGSSGGGGNSGGDNSDRSGGSGSGPPGGSPPGQSGK